MIPVWKPRPHNEWRAPKGAIEVGATTGEPQPMKLTRAERKRIDERQAQFVAELRAR